MNYIPTIVKNNKKAVKKVVKKREPKYKPLLIVYQGVGLSGSLLFACLPEDEGRILKEAGVEMRDKESYKRIVLTEKSKSEEGWLFDVRSSPSKLMPIK